MKTNRREVADLLEKPGYVIRRAHQMSVALFEAKLACFKITAPQHLVMTAIYKHPHVDQATLADMVGLDKVTAGNIVIRLERRGLVERKRSPYNWRALALTVSKAGESLLLRTQDVVDATIDEMFENLSTHERTVLMRLLRRMIGAEPPSRAVNARAGRAAAKSAAR
ncbi:MarR family transcriptional regulator [Vineibacter terrae]|uniref:MarR family transcriptional regulator n=1 Tax=Vineibacter terrae TaxID=2586908 RepID=A0A5C8P7H5_9HYPH|nr:MarR family transcriptional regulator [Vineibacter terrae]TXL69462.1 MarR family transcriptional regulator [Vineibacter terrae]